MNLKNKKVTVMGLGLLGGGLGTTKWLSEKGADVLVTDLKSKEELRPSLKKLEGYDLKYRLGEHKAQDFEQADLIVKNPAVRDDSKYLRIARNNDVPIETEMSLFFKFCPCPVIGITGTKGKSTVATLIYKLLKQSHHAVLGGNIKTETLPKLKELSKKSLAVLELSSWQLSSLDKKKLSPHVAVITNIKQDHLNRYDHFEDYVEDKAAIYKHQNEKDHLVLNDQDEISSRFADSAQAQVHYYNSNGKKESRGARLKNGSICFQGEAIMKEKEVKLTGRHNLINVMAAITVAKIYDVKNEIIKKVVSDFKGLPHRLELVKKNRIDFYDDSCATNPVATMAALNSFDGKVVLIAGGSEKNLEFDQLAQVINQKVKGLILLRGEATPHLRKSVEEVMKDEFPVERAKDMKKAIKKAKELAGPEGTVLLSPACASFDQFTNEFDRGEKFKEAVKNE